MLLSSMEDVASALERNKGTMGSRYVSVIRISREEYYGMAHEAMLRHLPTSAAQGSVRSTLREAEEGSIVMMRGIPFQASYRDVCQFFKGDQRVSCLMVLYFASFLHCIIYYM